MAILIHVEVHREGRFWVISIPTIEAVTQAYRWNQIRAMAQDCAALLLDLPAGRVKIGAVRRVREPDWHD